MLIPNIQRLSWNQSSQSALPFAVTTDIYTALDSLHLFKCVLLTTLPDGQGRNYPAAEARGTAGVQRRCGPALPILLRQEEAAAGPDP